MKIVYRIDDNGFFIEEVQIHEDEELPNDCVDCDFPQGLYKPRFVNGGFISSLTQEQINVELNGPKPKTQEEQIAELNLQIIDLYETLINGGLI